MKIPNKIILNGEIYKIILVSKKDLECENCGEDALATIKPNEKLIYLSVDDKENPPIELLWHELGHYWADYYGLGDSEAWAEGFSKFVSIVYVCRIVS